MIGAIIGDVVGSVYEWHNIKTKNFKLITNESHFTDDTVLTCAVAQALMNSDLFDNENIRYNVIKELVYFAKKYPDVGYGGKFVTWFNSDKKEPCNSFGNGSAMRVSPVGWVSSNLWETPRIAEVTASVTHNHIEGIKGAVCVADMIYMARQGFKKDVLKIRAQEFYNLDFTLNSIRPYYKFDASCQGSVPQSIVAFLESDSFEDAIRNAISIGGDSDTIGAITGSIAEAYYGVPDHIVKTVAAKLPKDLRTVVESFCSNGNNKKQGVLT